MRHLLTNLLYALLAVVVLSSCGSSRKKIVYVQGAEEIGTFQNANSYAQQIIPDDKLTIVVNCKEPELAAPFNMQLSQKAFSAVSNVTFNTNGGTLPIFWVDAEGYIEYPTIGRLKVLGMTRYELQNYLCDYLKSKGYIQDPIVTVEFNNAKYSLLGEVTRPGQFTMTSDRVSIFDAIALAGDLTIYGERDKVRFIREENGHQTVTTLNLTDPDLINSPYYFLRQNDVIYVEPNKAKASNREVSSLYTFGISIISACLTIANIIVTIQKL